MTIDTERTVTLTVNGVPREATVPVRRLLSDALRHDLGLTGTHVGCEHGVCGACTVLIDGAPVRSCLVLAVGVHGRSVTTVEGLSRPDHRGGQLLHPIQESFRECHALQCGFCTPGFLTTIAAGLDARDASVEITDAEVDELVGGNLCRCTGYANIRKAVHHAAATMRESAITAVKAPPEAAFTAVMAEGEESR
jgi:carbon-monoxide dehydrogenase small subunit